MKYLGIDYGTKKIGLALSDEEGTIAFPHEVIPNDVQLEATIHDLVQTQGVHAVVVGDSKNFGGEPNDVAEQAHAFAQVLQETTGLEVHFEPEFLTTKQAKQHTDDAHADAAAAALILQTFLDKQTENIPENY